MTFYIGTILNVLIKPCIVKANNAVNVQSTQNVKYTFFLLKIYGLNFQLSMYAVFNQHFN